MKTNTNKVELTGFAGTNAEVKEIREGLTRATFRMATSEGYKNRDDEWVNSTSWHNIVLWNKAAKKASEAIKKGLRISLSGRISYRTYETNKGEKRQIVEIVAGDFELLPALKAG